MASTSFTDGVTLTAAAWFNDVDTATYASLSAVAGTNTITATGPTSISAYAAGQRFVFIPANTNSGATTLNISSLGAKSIFKNFVALVGGELQKSMPALVVYDGTRFHLLSNSAMNFPRMHISGLTYANNSGDATNDIDIAVGSCRDATNIVDMVLSSTLTKQLDAAWAVGTNAGGLDTGSIGNSDYYIWLIQRSDTGVVDALYSLSSTAPTMPTSYDYKRLIGWFKRVGATIVAFHTYETEGGGIEMKWDVPTTDVNLANTLTTARRTDAVKVPLNFSTVAIVNVAADDAGEAFIRVMCPDETDAAVSASNCTVPVHTVALGRGYQRFVRTSATGTVASRASVATVDNYSIQTDGFRWARRN